MQRCSDRRYLVHTGTILAHKLPTVVGSNASNSVLCQRQKEYNHSTADGQHQAVSYVNNMGGTISEQSAQLARDLWMWCLQRNIHLVAQNLPGKLNVIADMEPRPRLIVRTRRSSHQYSKFTGSWYICILVDSSGSTVFQSETRSTCYSNQCIPTGLGSTEGICKPFMGVDRQSPIASTGTNSRPGTSSTSLERSDMVRNTVGYAIDYPLLIPQKDNLMV